ncbi:MAG: helix-turn-helix domain-containing protein [Burkholderiales bacterium]
MRAVKPTPAARPPKPDPRRPRGRPVQRDDRDAREALLDAAVALFAERGVAATTAGDIATRAGVTPAMIHYYFRGRAKLIDAVVDERMSRFVDHVFAAPPATAAPRPGQALAMLPALVARIFEAARLMPWMPPIWIREIASEGGLLRERALRRLPAASIGGVGDLLAAAQRRGEIAPGIEPRVVFVSIMGLTLFPLATQAVWRRMPGADRITLDDLQRHATTLLASGLAAHVRPAGSGPRRPR